MRCHYCHLKGHHFKVCRKRLADEAGKSTPQSRSLPDGSASADSSGSMQANYAHYLLTTVATTPITSQDKSWYLDSGASHHMTFPTDYFFFLHSV